MRIRLAFVVAGVLTASDSRAAESDQRHMPDVEFNGGRPNVLLGLERSAGAYRI